MKKLKTGQQYISIISLEKFYLVYVSKRKKTHYHRDTFLLEISKFNDWTSCMPLKWFARCQFTLNWVENFTLVKLCYLLIRSEICKKNFLLSLAMFQAIFAQHLWISTVLYKIIFAFYSYQSYSICCLIKWKISLV